MRIQPVLLIGRLVSLLGDSLETAITELLNNGDAKAPNGEFRPFRRFLTGRECSSKTSGSPAWTFPKHNTAAPTEL